MKGGEVMALYPQSAFINNIMNSITAIGLFNDGVELSGSNYARVSITPSTQLQVTSDANNYYITNSVQLSFVQATADWGAFNQIGIFAGGNLWFLIDVSSRIVRANDQVFIDVGQLRLIIPKSIT
jgi:hypothetical protein